jgi:hypothetical protein
MSWKNHCATWRQKEKQMDFGWAIQQLKESRLVRRAGWNGKGMHLYLEEHLSFTVKATKTTRGIDRKYEPVICMFTAQQKHQPGWLANQADMLAMDWELATD